MATAAVSLVPVEEYLLTTYRPDCDWVDGEVRTRNVGEGAHSYLQGFFVKHLGWLEGQLSIRVLPEQRLQVAMDRFRVPDVVVLDGAAPFESVVKIPPIVCIEILSPDDSMSSIQERLDDYLEMGVPQVWVVDPRRRKLFAASAAGIVRVEELVLPGRSCMLSTVQIFTGLDALERLKQPTE